MARAVSALAVALAAGRAAATTITVDFNVPPSEEVGFLCVAYDGGADGAGAVGRAESFEKWKDVRGTPRDLVIGKTPLRLANGKKDASDPSRAPDAIDKAFNEMARRSGEDKNVPPDICGEHAGFCAPQLPMPPVADAKKPPRPLWLMCAANGFLGGKRVVIVKPKFDGQVAPKLLGVTLYAGTGVLQFAGPDVANGKPQPQATVGVFGGDYEGQSAPSSPDGRVKLTMAARCTQRELRLPRMALDQASGDRRADKKAALLETTVRPSGAEPVKCASPFAAAIPLLLPRGGPGSSTRVDVTAKMPSSDDGKAFESTFVAGWREGEPPVSIDAGVSVAQFQWRAGCEYLDTSRNAAAPTSAAVAAPECPPAAIVEAGVECTGEPLPNKQGPAQLVCAYKCDPVAPEIPLPLTIRFQTKNGQDAWTDRLSAVGQTLTGYTDRQHRYFPANFGGLDIKQRGAADKIDHVRVSTSSGEVSVFRPEEGGSYRIALPGGTCGDELAYQYVGDLDYEEKATRVQQGAIAVPPPEISERRFYPMFSVGGGLLTPRYGAEQVEPFGLISLQVRWYVPWRNSSVTPVLALRYAYGFGRQHYLAAYGMPERQEVLFQRHFFTAPMGAFVLSWLRLEFVPGLINNEPLLFRDSPATGASFWALTLGGQAGARLSRRVEIQASLAWLFRDQVFEFVPRLDGNPALITHERITPVLSVELLFRP